MSRSPFEKLALHCKPVDKNALRVGFFRGEHFDVEFTEDRPKRRVTLDAPPTPRLRPERATDYTGLRKGRMTAFAWHRASGGVGATVWVARCDCGRFEFRRPGKWAANGNPNDMCEVCEREAEMLRGPSSRKRHPERLMKWAARLLRMGITEAELCVLRAGDIPTHGRTTEEIRAAIAEREGDKP